MKKFFTVTFILIFGAALAFSVFAQSQQGGAEEQSLSLTVTPPLVQVTMNPGQTWHSVLKIVNANTYDLTVFATPVNFQAIGEEGASRFIPILGEDLDAGGHSLAQWIKIMEEPIVVPRNQSVSIEYTIRVPENAEPGGHYGAILIGPRASRDVTEGSSVSVSALVSSLMFVRIPGDVREQGNIREFRAEKTRYEKPDVSFVLRFENTGNVHLQPQGDITIYNMWSKQRGYIPINQKSDFGNVLPESVRKFEFAWKGEQNLFEVGRYKAVATLGYGYDSKQFASGVAYFWIVPLKATFIIFGSFIIFIALIIFGIRVYVRRVIAIQQKLYGIDTVSKTHVPVLSAITAPITESIIDLRKFIREEKSDVRDRVQSEVQKMDISSPTAVRQAPLALRLVRRYAALFVFISALILGIIGFVVYFAAVFTKERSYEITVPQGNREVTLSSEEIIKDTLEIQNKLSMEDAGSGEGAAVSDVEYADTDGTIEQEWTLAVLNGSGVVGSAARLAADFEARGYRIDRLGNAEHFNYSRTTIYYASRYENEARIMASNLTFEAVLRVRDDQAEDVVMVIGKDYASE